MAIGPRESKRNEKINESFTVPYKRKIVSGVGPGGLLQIQGEKDSIIKVDYEKEVNENPLAVEPYSKRYVKEEVYLTFSSVDMKEKSSGIITVNYAAFNENYDKISAKRAIGRDYLFDGHIDDSLLDAASVLSGLKQLPEYVTRMIPELKATTQ